MTGVSKQTRSERLAALAAAIFRIVEEKKVLLRAPTASTRVAMLACHRWQLTKAVCNYRWFIKSALAPCVRVTETSGQAAALIAAVDAVHDLLSGYVLHWSNGDNTARWPDYQAAATATLDDIATRVRRISDASAVLLPETVAPDGAAPRGPLDRVIRTTTSVHE